VKKRTRVLIGKLGLDGHDRGAKMLTLALRDSGMEVIYTGLRQTPESIVKTAIEEDVHIMGLSFASGAHLAYTQKVMSLLEGKGLKRGVRVLVGGTIPQRDVEKLKRLGVAEVFPTGSQIEKIINYIESCP
jgi:methylmalonyl-CoA mutase C-terminal domain/subunit